MEKYCSNPVIIGACAAIIASLGIAFSGFFIGRSIEKFKFSDRFVVVKGLSEKAVKADFAELSVDCKNAGDDLPDINKKKLEDLAVILKFLKDNGITDEEISAGNAYTTDNYVRDYTPENKPRYRYETTSKTIVRTKNVQAVEKLIKEQGQLMEQNINCQVTQRYSFNSLSAIRAEMLEEATKNARQAAMQFAKDSHLTIGAIRKATQGAFSIKGISNDHYDCASDRDKKVRVVVTVTFNLEG